MKKSVLTTSIAFISVLASSWALASEKPHWGYEGHSGPEHWGELAPDYETCGKGKNQSPINLTGMVEATLPALSLAYQTGGQSVLNNGHTVQVSYEAGSQLTVDERRFELKQFHFHVPSENRIEGESFPMEAHFVHADQEGNLAVLALMFKEGAVNAELHKAWSQMPAEAGESEELANLVDALKLIPANQDYYRFTGSLTTPPCSEGVIWLVLKTPATASKAQIERFSQLMAHGNNRPVQPVNARVILQ